MSKVMVWKSDTDGKLFEDKANYTKHLRKLAAERQAQRKIEKMEAERESFIQQMGQVESISALNKFIKDNWSWFWANGAKHEHFRYSNRSALPIHEYVDVSIISTQWVENLSNSHSCPRTGKTNWGGYESKNGVPRGYPGWHGRINIKVKPPMSGHKKDPYMLQGWGSSYFDRTIINTGGGGGGVGTDIQSYSYDVNLWAADFPVMYEALRRSQYLDRENARRQREWRYLGGKGSVPQITEIPEDWVVPDPLVGW